MSNRQRKRRSKRRRTSVRTTVVGGGALALTLISASAAQAKTYKVTTLKDPAGPAGTVSLEQAIDDANEFDSSATPSDPAVITFASKLSGAIDVTSALPGIDVPMDIRGPGAHKLTIDAAALTERPEPLFYDYTGLATAALTISGLSIADTKANSVEDTAGAVSSDSGALKLENDIFSHDSSETGGSAVHDDGRGAVTISDCTFSDDSAPFNFNAGGAVSIEGAPKLTITDSTFNGDSAVGNAGALVVDDTPTTISDSTFVRNVAHENAGAILLNASATTIAASTITGNSAKYTGSSTEQFGYGGGVEVQDTALILKDTIVAGNDASGNRNDPGFPALGSVFADVWVAGGGALQANFSLIQHDTNVLPDHSLNATDITGKSADLGPLANNGGTTKTELPKKHSPVINAGKAYGLKTDQRGDRRTVDYPGVKKRKGSDGTDIGAVELQAPKRRHRH